METVFAATREVFTPSLVSVLVVILVNLPILALTGVEGKMFRPMALTVIIALIAALALSLTFVPAAVALFLPARSKRRRTSIVRGARRLYAPVLECGTAVSCWRSWCGAVVFVIACGWLALAHGLGVHSEPR